MITVIIKDEYSDNVEITRLEFACLEQADEQMGEVMDDFLAMYGSGSSGFYGILEGYPLGDGEIMSCEDAECMSTDSGSTTSCETK